MPMVSPNTDQEQRRLASSSGPDSTPRTFPEWVQNATSLLTGLVALVAISGTFVDKLQTWIPWFTPDRRTYLFAIGVVLLAVTFVLQKRRLVKRSEIKDPDALLLRTGKYLIGREEDIESVTSLLTNAPLTWLVGESGCGKSSLLQAGIASAFKTNNAHLLVYMDSWGSDWVEGPRQALLDAVRRAWTESMPPTNQMDITSATLLERLGKLREATGRLPVLLFDQFDDYQVRHRLEFISPRRSLLSAKVITQKNPFWFEVEDLLRKELIHCLFVTRDDAAAGLECVRFVPPEVYHLERLRRGHALPLLEKLTAEDVVSNPDASWHQLSREVCADMEADGNLLPIQMRVIFRSIVDLHPLTTGAYRKQGGLRGLEAAHIHYHVSEIARYSGVEEAAIRRILLALVDREDQKTLPALDRDLLCWLPEDSLSQGRLDRILGALADKEIVRKRIDPDTRQQVWLLDHDYLCRGVIELDRRANFWPHLLDQSCKAFRAAKGLRATWNTLLPASIQVRILFERFRGRLLYGDATKLAYLSLSKLVFNLPVLVLVVTLYAGLYLRTQSEANRLFDQIGLTEQHELTSEEADALWALSRADYSVKRALLVEAISQRGSAQRFVKRHDSVVHAIVGIKGSIREKLADDLLPKCDNLPNEWNARWEACLWLRVELNPHASPKDQWNTAWWISQFLTNIDNLKPEGKIEHKDELDALAERLAILARELGQSNAKDAAFSLILPLADNSYLSEIPPRALGWGLSGLTKLGESDTDFFASTLLEDMKDKVISDPEHFHGEPQLLAALPHLRPSDACAGASLVLDAMKKTPYPEIADYQGQDLSALGAKVTEDCALRLIEKAYGLYKGGSYERLAFSHTIVSLAGRLNESGARTITPLIVEALRTDDSPDTFGAVAVLPALDEFDARAAAFRIVEWQKRVTWGRYDDNLPQALVALIPKLSKSDASAAAFQYLATPRKSEKLFPEKLPADLIGALSQSDTRKLHSLVLEDLNKTSKSSLIRDDAALLAALPEFTDADAHAAATRIIEAMTKELQQSRSRSNGSDDLQELGQGLAALSLHLTDAEIHTALSLGLETMKRETHAYGLYWAARWVAPIVARLPESDRPKLDTLEQIIAGFDEPPCDAVALFADHSTVPEVVEVLKWPTCSFKDRSEVIKKIGELEGHSFGTTIGDEFVVDESSFEDWTSKQGFKVSSPPIRKSP
jgi:hypothetical protein